MKGKSTSTAVNQRENASVKGGMSSATARATIMFEHSKAGVKRSTTSAHCLWVNNVFLVSVAAGVDEFTQSSQGKRQPNS